MRGSEIVGLGPSRVVVIRDWTAHAEREAIRWPADRIELKRLPYLA